MEALCEAIQAPFEYGLIFNKVSRAVRQKIKLGGIEPYLVKLPKKPYATVCIKLDKDLEDLDNLYLKADSRNRKNLLNFLNQLKSVPINQYDVKPVLLTKQIFYIC